MHPIPFIIVGLLLFRFAKGKEIYQIIGIIVAALATVFFLILSVSLVPDFLELRSAYKSGDRSVVEGTVDDFHPAPALGAAKESFSVNGIVFSYNVLDATPCFNNALGKKSRIQSGLKLRIYYKAECIQRVDILK